MKALGLLAVLLCVALTGCVNPSKVMESWQGHHQSELIADWGPPVRTASDGKGGSILIYESYRNLGQSPGQARYDGAGNVTYTAPQQQGYVRTHMFYVNPQGIIYAYRWRGY